MTSLCLFFILSGLFGCTGNHDQLATNSNLKLEPQGLPELYSNQGKEYQVEFKAFYLSQKNQIEQLESEDQIRKQIIEVNRFLFGPLNRRLIASPQKGQTLQILRNELTRLQGRIAIPYIYRGTWIIDQDIQDGEFEIPVPYSTQDLKTERWQSCTDPAPDHNTWSFFWYFWDPNRASCDHQDGRQYQTVKVRLLDQTEQTRLSYPEYKRMVRIENGVPTVSMTFAFGYVDTPYITNPFQDQDYGMMQFREFYRHVKTLLQNAKATEEPILQKEYGYINPTPIGARFLFSNNKINYRISIVASGGVDQMEIFAKSFTIDHESFFGWFGHSRVGAGFDSDLLKSYLKSHPNTYTITSDYQLVYWAGCNSYSYYTLPFFEMKAALDPQNDSHGTKNLDIISNGFPSLFSFNAANAKIALSAILSWNKQPKSYQEIINAIENYADRSSTRVLVNVLGDEDNN